MPAQALACKKDVTYIIILPYVFCVWEDYNIYDLVIYDLLIILLFEHFIIWGRQKDNYGI